MLHANMIRRCDYYEWKRFALFVGRMRKTTFLPPTLSSALSNIPASSLNSFGLFNGLKGAVR